MNQLYDGLPYNMTISLFKDKESRWAAVQERNPNADGLFVYAVKTTKIYCRPICKARLPRRANVDFYEFGTEAQLKGFRACKRCKPEMEGCMPEEMAVRKIRAFVHDQTTGNKDVRLSLSQMAKQTGLSKWHFHRVFKKCVGVTPTEFLRQENETQQQLHTPPLTDDGLGWLLPTAAKEQGENVENGLFDENQLLLSQHDWFSDFLLWPEDTPTTS